jgi:hypothetical protein
VKRADLIPSAAPWPCAHLTTDDPWTSPDGLVYVFRSCLLCGLLYDRGAVLVRLREAIRERHRLPPSPWSAQERAEDVWS